MQVCLLLSHCHQISLLCQNRRPSWSISFSHYHLVLAPRTCLYTSFEANSVSPFKMDSNVTVQTAQQRLAVSDN